MNLGRFIVLSQLGRGGMGEVYCAYDPELDRKVAVKLVRRDGARGRDDDPDATARLVREAQAMARLIHPNVVTVYDVGVHEGQVFIAMEFVEGATLRQWLAEPRPWREILERFTLAGRGLAAAHRDGIVHRDFKPANVLIGSDGRLRVSDFGLALLAPVEDRPAAERAARSGSPDLTLTGELLGTPAYMAPEQLRGEATGVAADQFGFCVSLYEALYGVHPFAGEDVDALEANIRLGRMRPPPERSDVPAAVRRAVLRGLAPEPAARWASMDALCAALAAESARHDPARRRRRWLALAVMAPLVAGAAYLTQRAARGPEPICDAAAARGGEAWNDAARRRVRAAFLATGRGHAADTYARVERLLDERLQSWRAARVDACEATHVRGEQSPALLDLRMRCLDRRLDETRALASLFGERPDPDLVDNAVRAVGKLAPLTECADAEGLSHQAGRPRDPEVEALVKRVEAQLDRAGALQKAGRYKEGAGVARAAAAAARAVGWPPLAVQAQLLLGNLLELSGDYAAALVELEEASRAAARAADDAAGARALMLQMLVMGFDQARYEPAQALWPAVDAAVTRAGDLPLLRADVLRARAAIFQATGKLDDALAAQRAALALYEKTRPADDPEIGAVLNNLGSVLHARGDLEEALKVEERVLAFFVRVLGPEHPWVATAMSNLGNTQWMHNERAKAQTNLEKALAAQQRLYGPEHPMVASTLIKLGALSSEEGHDEEALTYLRRALAIRERVFGAEHPNFAQALDEVGSVLFNQGKLDEAQALHERALAIKRKAFGEGHPKVATSLARLGNVLLARKQYKEARKVFEEALAMREKFLGADHIDTARSLDQLAKLHVELGEYARAEEYLRRAMRIYEASMGADSLDMVVPVEKLGVCEAKLGHRAEAEALFKRALDLAEKNALGEEHLARIRGELAAAGRH